MSAQATERRRRALRAIEAEFERDRKKLGLAEAEARADRAIWDWLPVDLQRGRTVLAIARATGCEFWFSDPQRTTLQIDIPRSLPEPLRGQLFLHLFLNAKALGELLGAEGTP